MAGGKSLSLRPSPKRSWPTLSSGLSRRNATLKEAASPRSIICRSLRFTLGSLGLLRFAERRYLFLFCFGHPIMNTPLRGVNPCPHRDNCASNRFAHCGTPIAFPGRVDPSPLHEVVRDVKIKKRKKC